MCFLFLCQYPHLLKSEAIIFYNVLKIPVTAIAQYTFDKHFLLLKDSVFGSSLLLITLKLHLCINNVQQIQNSILCLALIGFDKNQFFGGRRTEFTKH